MTPCTERNASAQITQSKPGCITTHSRDHRTHKHSLDTPHATRHTLQVTCHRRHMPHVGTRYNPHMPHTSLWHTRLGELARVGSNILAETLCSPHKRRRVDLTVARLGNRYFPARTRGSVVRVRSRRGRCQCDQIGRCARTIKSRVKKKSRHTR